MAGQSLCLGPCRRKMIDRVSEAAERELARESDPLALPTASSRSRYLKRVQSSPVVWTSGRSRETAWRKPRPQGTRRGRERKVRGRRGTDHIPKRGSARARMHPQRARRGAEAHLVEEPVLEVTERRALLGMGGRDGRLGRVTFRSGGPRVRGGGGFSLDRGSGRRFDGGGSGLRLDNDGDSSGRGGLGGHLGEKVSEVG